jgi:hypothetical protein
VSESTKVDFQHRRISQLSDFTELIEMLFPGNRNQRYAAACMFFELKWADGMVLTLAYLEAKYGMSRRVLQRAHIQQMDTHGEGIARLNAERGRWKVCPMDGECAYNWGRYQEQPGDNPNDTLADPVHRARLMDTIRRLHGNDLGWVASYNAADPLVHAGAEEVQKAFGYRLVVEQVRYDATVAPGQAFHVSFAVRNTGSAPFYYAWPVEASLLDPVSREIVWKDTFKGIDIRSWLPGDQWNSKTKRYDIEAATYDVDGSFIVREDLVRGDYVLALAILDPAGMVPSVRFAIENYMIGGRHPIGFVGVGKVPSSTELDPASFDDPSQDRTLHYELASSAGDSRGN